MVQLKCLSVKMKDLCLEMFTRYLKHIGENLTGQFKCADLDPKQLQFYTNVSRYIVIMTGNRLKEINHRRGRAIKANHIASLFVSGIVKNELTGLFSLKLSMDENTARELGMSLVLANISTDDVTTVLTIPILQCRSPQLMEQCLAALLALVIDTGFPINVNDFVLMRCQSDPETGQVIPIVGSNADQIEHLFVNNISLWFYSGEKPFILGNLHHATKEKCHRTVCCVDNNLSQLSLKEKMEKTRGNSMYTIQECYPLMGQSVPDYGLFLHDGGESTLEESEKANALPKFTWLTDKISVNKSHGKTGEEEYRVVSLDSAPTIPDFMTSTYKKKDKKPKFKREALSMVGQINIDEEEDDPPYETITKFIDPEEVEEPEEDNGLELPELTANQQEQIRTTVRRTLRFDPETIAKDMRGASNAASGAVNSTQLMAGSPGLVAPNLTRITPRVYNIVNAGATPQAGSTPSDNRKENDLAASDTRTEQSNSEQDKSQPTSAAAAAAGNQDNLLEIDLTSGEPSNDDSEPDNSGIAHSKNPSADISALIEELTLLNSNASEYNANVLANFTATRRFYNMTADVTRLLRNLNINEGEPDTNQSAAGAARDEAAPVENTSSAGATKEPTNPFLN